MNVEDLKGRTVGFLASGGLDSCTTTRWLTDNGVKVVTFTGDLGQPDETDLNVVAERMLKCGAEDSIIVPLREAMAARGIAAVQAQARYEGSYWGTTALARHTTVAGILPELQKRKISVLSHGATGRGNDQVRFQLITNMLDPEIEVYAPWRDESFLTRFPGREEMLEFCEEKKLPLQNPNQALYSTDANLLGLTHEAGELESLQTKADFVTPGMGVRAEEAPDKSEIVEIVFKNGWPTTINGKKMASADQALTLANEIGGRNAVGINLHVVENRFVGIKSRGIYEAPGMELLGSAYALLLQLILDRRAREWFDASSTLLAKQIYQGYGFDLASQMAESAIERVTQLADGTITVSLYKGNVQFIKADNVPHSIYIEENASMSGVGSFNHADSEGFLQVLGQGARALAVKKQIDKEAK
jgi:argininosuccinate synthase